MSLKTFHLIFILIAILFSFGTAWWAFSHPADELDGSLRQVGMISVGVGALFLVYLPFFIRKSRSIRE